MRSAVRAASWILALLVGCGRPSTDGTATDARVESGARDTDERPDTDEPQDTDPDDAETDVSIDTDTDRPPDTDPADTLVPSDSDAADSDVPLDTDTDTFDLCAWLAANPEPPGSVVARIEVACPVPASLDCAAAPYVLTTEARLAFAFMLQSTDPAPDTCQPFQGTCVDFVGVPRDGVICTAP